jgi:hypothetical protein
MPKAILTFLEKWETEAVSTLKGANVFDFRYDKAEVRLKERHTL